jgi:ArsR family transcriptional regulator, arsenate/arsenite/antimonite-responsive transcriptional repressor
MLVYTRTMPTLMQLEPQSGARLEPDIERVSEVFKALSDPARLRIVQFLAHPSSTCCANADGVCACDLEAITGLSQPTVSHHMKILAQAGLINAHKRGKWMYYSLENSGFKIIQSLISNCCQA